MYWTRHPGEASVGPRVTRVVSIADLKIVESWVLHRDVVRSEGKSEAEIDAEIACDIAGSKAMERSAGNDPIGTMTRSMSHACSTHAAESQQFLFPMAIDRDWWAGTIRACEAFEIPVK